MRVRDASDADLLAVQKIYAHYVLNTVSTFEETPPPVEDMRSRSAVVVAAGLPYLVAEIDGCVVGYAYATAYRPRAAYRYTVEDSVYVADGFRGRGVGNTLLH